MSHALIPDLASLAFAAFLFALFQRASFAVLSSRIRAGEAGIKRANARIEAYKIANPDDSELQSSEGAVKIWKEEDATLAPRLMIVVSFFVLWIVSVVGIWIWSTEPLSDPLWWLGLPWAGAWAAFAFLKIQTDTTRMLSPKRRASAAIVACAPIAIFYAVAPGGVLVWSMFRWVLSRVIWFVFPWHGDDDLPPIALIFL